MNSENNNLEAEYGKRKKKRFLITVSLLIVSLILTLYFHFVLKIGIIFTHFFYIPIVIASIWWGGKGLLMTIGLGIFLVASNFFSGNFNYMEDLFRSFFFVIVSYLASTVSDAEKEMKYKFFESRKILKLKENIIYLISHQLLTPITSIKWLLDKIFKDETWSKFSENQKESLLEIEEQTEKSTHLIKSFLYLNKIESKKIKSFSALLDINELVQKIILEKESLTDKKHIKVYFEKSDLSEISIDSQIIRQIMENLFSNAVKYTPAEGNIKISVQASDREFFFKISDNGCGIPKNEQSRIFENFYRGSNVIAASIDGVGLGLSIVKGLVDFCDGKVWFESEENKGTTFYFTLPIKQNLKKENA